MTILFPLEPPKSLNEKKKKKREKKKKKKKEKNEKKKSVIYCEASHDVFPQVFSHSPHRLKVIQLKGTIKSIIDQGSPSLATTFANDAFSPCRLHYSNFSPNSPLQHFFFFFFFFFKKKKIWPRSADARGARRHGTRLVLRAARTRPACDGRNSHAVRYFVVPLRGVAFQVEHRQLRKATAVDRAAFPVNPRGRAKGTPPGERALLSHERKVVARVVHTPGKRQEDHRTATLVRRRGCGRG
jgi:hypothetical protein